MESQNKTLQNTSKKQQLSVISKLHNMQWLKNNVPLSGHIKSRKLKKNVDDLSDLEVVKFDHTSVNNNIELSNSINTIFTTYDNNCDFEIDNDITDKSVLSTRMVSTWNLKNNLENNSSLLSKQELDFTKLKENKIINMTTTDSSIIKNLEIKNRLQKQGKGNTNTLNIATKDRKNNAVVCNLVPLKVQDNIISKIDPTKLNDKNNNDKLNSTKKSNSKSDIVLTTIFEKDNEQEKTSNNISLNQEKSSDSLCTTKEDPCSITLSKTSNIANKSKKIHEHQNLTVDNKLKAEIKNLFKNETTIITKKPIDKKDHQSHQPILNISKEFKSKCNLQSKKEFNIKYSSESMSKCNNKNIKENEQNKTTLTNNINRQSKVNRVNPSFKKTDNRSTPKTHNSSLETTQYSVKEKRNHSNSFYSSQLKTTAKPFNMQEEGSILNKQLINSDDKSDNIKSYITIEIEQVTKIPTLERESINTCIDDKKIIDTITQELNTSFKDIKMTNRNITENISNKHFVNEFTEQKEIYADQLLQDSPNLNMNTQNIKESAHNSFCNSDPQFNMYSSNVWHGYENLQQNIYQQQTSETPTRQDFVHPIQNSLAGSYPMNTTLPQFIPNVSHPDVNAMHLNQYENVPIMQNNSMNTNSVSNSDLHTNTKTVNMQYQMPNMVPYNNSNLVRPQTNYNVPPPMTTQDEQYNLTAYGMNYLYYMNSCYGCRNDNYYNFQNWNMPNVYPVPLASFITNSYQCNCNLCCNQLQSNHMTYKNPDTVKPTSTYIQEEVPSEQNLQRNSVKPMSKSWYNDRNLQNNEAYNTNIQTQEVIINMQEQFDRRQKIQDAEFLNDKETINLPIISPRDCMSFENGFPANIKTIRPHTNNNKIKEQAQNYNTQYKKCNKRSFFSREYVSNAKTDCGKKSFK